MPTLHNHLEKNIIPVVSIIITVYNGRQFIKKAIDSILCQTYKSWELIIVNDGSQDRTAEIVSEYSKMDARILMIQRPHEGRVKALNIGLKVARGRYIAILDADDVAYPERLERQVNFLNDHAETGILGTWCEIVAVNSNKCWTWKTPITDKAIRKYILKGMPIAHPSMMMRRNVVTTIDGYREYKFEDYDFVIRTLQKFSATNIPEVLVKINAHPGSRGNLRIGKFAIEGIRTRIRAISCFSPPLKVPFYILRTFLIILVRIIKKFIA